jgi:hypothetical protein
MGGAAWKADTHHDSEQTQRRRLQTLSLDAPRKEGLGCPSGLPQPA